MADASIDIASLINENRIGRFQYWVVTLCALTVFLDGFDTQAIAFVAPSLVKEWHVPREGLGPIFVASLVGLLVGALTCGPIADKIGRRKVLMACTFLFGAFSIATGFAENVTQILLLRFLTGLGLGGAMPNAIALTAEYCPHRRRATLVMIMFTGFSLGAAISGVLAAAILPHLGWQGVFWIGGAMPLCLLPLQWIALPESVRFLVLSGAPQERLRAIVARVVPNFAPQPGARFGSHEIASAGMPVAHLFRDRRAIGTLLLWIMFFCNLLDLFFLQNWLPVLLGDNGIAVTQAVFIGGLFQFGGVAAALATGFFIDRFTGYLVLPALYALGCALVLLLGQGGSQTTMTVLTFIAGFCIVGAQASANAHAAMFYPTFIRSSGVGWCLGIGRLGAIIGPLLAGLLLSLHWPVASLFILLSLPLATACVAVLIMGALYAKGRTLAETLTAATSEPAK